MDLDELRQQGFKRFIETNFEHFAGRAAKYPQSPGAILVDLCHDNPGYLHLNCLTAKYLQRFLGGRLIGIYKSWPNVLAREDFQQAQDFGESFDFSEVINADVSARAFASAFEFCPVHHAFRQELLKLKGHNLRAAILSLSLPEAPGFGRLVYDTALRSGQIATIEQFDAMLARELVGTAAMIGLVSEIIKKHDIKATVAGHLDYNPYGVLSTVSLARSVPVYFPNILIPSGLQCFRQVSEWERGLPEDYHEVFRWVREQWARDDGEYTGFLQRRYAQRFAAARQTMPAGIHSQSALSESELREYLKLDPQRETVCVMSQALCDSVHQYGPGLFDDYGQWLRRTVEVAAEAPVNVLVKPHPLNRCYDSQGFFESLASSYEGHLSVSFLSGIGAPNEVLFRLSDCVVTVCGTPGYEAAMCGARVLLAGPSRYSTLSFANQPCSLDDYYAALRRPSSLPSMTPEKIQEAADFAAFEIAATKVRCALLPSIRKAGTPSYWNDAIEALLLLTEEEDPFLRGMEEMLRTGAGVLLNPDLWRAPRAPAAPEPR